jgi:hypothetical protein
MIRRSFFQTLAAALLPQPLHAAPKLLQPTCEPIARAVQHPAPVPDPEWLRKWRKIPKLEVVAKDLHHQDDPHQRELGFVILRHIGEGRPFTFRYTGGSEPGAGRSVLPTLLFSPDSGPNRMCCGDPTQYPDPSQTPIYLLGWCQNRQAARTFRLARMEKVMTSTRASNLTGKPD